jgi:hypothetical protein
MRTKIWYEDLKGKDYLGDVGIDGMYVIDLREMRYGIFGSEEGLVRTVKNAIMNLQFPSEARNFLTN